MKLEIVKQQITSTPKKLKANWKLLTTVQPMMSPHRPRYWPYQYEVNFNQIQEIERWCYNHFKSGNWRNASQFFAFKRREDYTLFLLRWS